MFRSEADVPILRLMILGLLVAGCASASSTSGVAEGAAPAESSPSEVSPSTVICHINPAFPGKKVQWSVAPVVFKRSPEYVDFGPEKEIGLGKGVSVTIGILPLHPLQTLSGHAVNAYISRIRVTDRKAKPKILEVHAPLLGPVSGEVAYPIQVLLDRLQVSLDCREQ